MVATLFVQIADIDGDAVEKKHLNWIVVDSIDFGVERHSQAEGGAVSRGFGKAKLEEMSFTSEVGSHTTKLMKAVTSGTPLAKITIDQCKSSDDAKTGLEVYLQWTLTDALVVSYKFSGSAEDIPKETWSFSYTKITCAYFGTDPKTLKLKKVDEYTWDVGAGAPS